ncbi:integrase domain-containing protein [Aliivibrio wodanis]|uniref:integrase domain-containing protein n=1 Tax=Aliivibrio wodanis TaxID=80852 RepID=UPI00406C981A
MDRKLHVRNFGLGSRDMSRALVAAYKMKGNGDNSTHNSKSAFNDFAKHMKEEFEIKDLRKIEKSHVQSYAGSLNQRFEEEKMSASTAQNYLSKINVALSHARCDHQLHINPVKDAGLPNRTGIATSNHSVTLAEHNHAVNNVSERLGAIITLEREFGLRFKESCLIDAKSALQEAINKQVITVEFGTKGGKERTIPISSHTQISALERAADIQKHEHSMIPAEQKWSQFQNQSYREIHSLGFTFHSERHHFANHRYEKLTGALSPVLANVPHSTHHQYLATTLNISKQDARQLDHQARLQISKELGHERISITNNYLG